MKTTNLTVVARTKNPQFWLLAIAAGLIAIHISLVYKSGNSSLIGTSFLFWAAVSILVWEKRETLNIESGIFSSFLGLTLISLVLLKSVSMTSWGSFLYFSPFIIGFSLALLASGLKGLKQYRGELLALFVLGLPKLPPEWLINSITPLTAKLSAFMLWYTGFEVNLSGVNIYLEKGSIKVASGCSGVELILQMLGLALLFLLMFPQNKMRKILVTIIAGMLGFIVNSVRVAILAVIVDHGDREAFKYWHHGDGSLIFSMISVLLFGLFCWFLIGQNESNKQDAQSS